ncbi:MAG: phosphonate ABC transporter substrate-binding protein [Deltaproteobacteria bacterium]|jgi:phosphonate transport system substrate-binding protein|nr:phosphonate ABC transporter substrate-binding protein [Deltaproteobacteria bacterium]
MLNFGDGLFRKFLGAFGVLAALLWGAGGAAPLQAEGEEIDFGIISTESSQNLRTIWEPFLADMTRITGLKINAYFATDYAGVIEAMRFNKVQVAWFGNKAAMEAVDRADGEVFAQTVSADGSDGYYSVLIVHKDSPINNLEDLFQRAGELSFGNGDPNSTSGFLVPGYYVFALNGLDPKTAFKRTINASHEANALSVAGRQVDVATCNNENLARLEVTNPERRKDIKIIWTSPLIPSDPLVWRKDLDPAVKQKLLRFFLEYGQTGNAKETAILSSLLWKGFKKSDDRQLIPIRELELFQEKTKLEGQGSLSAADQNRLKAIDAELAALKKG